MNDNYCFVIYLCGLTKNKIKIKKNKGLNMDILQSLPPNLTQYVIIPLLIMFARMTDVSIGTIRIIFVSRGLKHISAILGFFEILIWLIAITQVLANLTNFVNYIAYAIGFAAGNYIGIFIEEKLAIGLLSIRIITRKNAIPLIDAFRKEKFGVTHIAARGISGQVKLILMIIKRKNLERIYAIINQYNPKAFVSVENVKTASQGVFPVSAKRNVTPNFRHRAKRK